MRRAALAPLTLLGALATACLQPSWSVCDDGTTCPATKVCAPAGCVTEDQVASCAGQPEGGMCLIGGVTGICHLGACSSPACGDGIVDPGEVCDDGNIASGDGCSGDCFKLEVCDGTVDAAYDEQGQYVQGERCDDGNANPTDGCDACVATGWSDATVIGDTTPCGDAGIGCPRAVAIDGLGQRYIADPEYHRVYRIAAGASSSTVIAGTGVAGFSGDNGAATSAQLREPSGVAIDTAGNLYIADRGNNRIRRIASGTNIITTLAGTGTFGFAGEAGDPAQTAELRGPTGLYFDATEQRLYVADAGNHVIRAIELAGGAASATISTVAGTPEVYGNEGDGLPATSAYLYDPQAVTRCSNGDLFIADTSSHRVRRVDTSGIISTVLGDGEPASSGQGVPATDFPVNTPLGLACDAMNNVYVTSSTTVRLLPTNGDGLVDGAGVALNLNPLPTSSTMQVPAYVSFACPDPCVGMPDGTACSLGSHTGGTCSADVCEGPPPVPGLAGVGVVDAQTVVVVHACTGRLIELQREPWPN